MPIRTRSRERPPATRISADGSDAKARSTAQITVRAARSVDEVEALRDVWERFGSDRVNAHIDLLLAVARTEPGVLRPHVLSAERGGEIEGLLVGRLEKLRLPCRVGYGSVPTPELRSITVVYGGLLGNADDDLLEALVVELRRSLSRGEADVAVFRELEVESPLCRIVRDLTPFPLRDRVSRRSVHRELALPASFDEFVRSLSKSTRDGLKRYRNKLEQELAGRLDVDIYRTADDLDDVMGALDTVAARSWQRALGTAFTDDAAHRERTLLALGRGWFRASVVSVDGRPVAFWQGLGCGGRLISGIPGFDPAYADYRIGTYAMVKLIESLCTDPAFTTFDFGFGDAEYKRRFGSASWEEQSVMIFAPRPKPLAVNLMRTLLVGATEIARPALVKIGLVGRARGAWRRRLRRRQ